MLGVELMCQTPLSFSATRELAGLVKLTWRAPPSTESRTPIGYRSEIVKSVNGGWPFERYIYEAPFTRISYHIGLDGGSQYAYRMYTKCGATDYSEATPWAYVSPWPVGSGGGGASGGGGVSGAGGIDPTPVPPGYGGAGSQHIDKTPSLPPQ